MKTWVTINSKILAFATVCAVLLYVALYKTQFHALHLQRFSHANNSTAELRSKIDSSDKWQRISVVNGTKNILWVYLDSNYRTSYGRSRFINAACRVNQCQLTYNATLMPYSQFDAFIFYQPEFKSPWILKDRRPDQVFIMYDYESPYMTSKSRNLTTFTKDFYNWTMTYRTDSDFPIKYGEILPLESAPGTPEEAATMRQEFLRMPGINPAKGKTKAILWMVSNCKAESNRQDYVKILQKFIDVDIFSADGKCGGQDGCKKKSQSVCYDSMEENYKFYLSFENSICKEYVTEKFFEVISRNIVPVVLGGAHYSAIAPQHSYINALDYTPRQLAAYLTELDRNDTLYAEYFWWKPHYRVHSQKFQLQNEAFCDVCEALHSRTLKTKTLRDVHKWYIEDANCQLGSTFQED